MSFDNERLTVRGRLAEKEQEAKRLEMSIYGDVSAVRTMLPPFAKIEEMQPQQAAVQAVELAAKHTDYLGLIGEIAAMKKALGIT
ncbi:MAG: hypothetical protein FP810_18385 [Desulfocapsa sp.]|nr:hypothetical protein [Desulfocapsa sp.]MBU4108122.1 hypothetical protein [Pseudomonadota bacterium]